MNTLSDEEWENLCDGCGHCCNLARSGVACPSLDTEVNACTVYEKRTKTEMCTNIRPGNVLRLHKAGVLPITCGYVRYQLLGVPYEHARLDVMRGDAKLIPFNMAHPSIQNEYLRQRKTWLMKLEVTDGEKETG